jgi:hypothetical protein
VMAGAGVGAAANISPGTGLQQQWTPTLAQRVGPAPLTRLVRNPNPNPILTLTPTPTPTLTTTTTPTCARAYCPVDQASPSSFRIMDSASNPGFRLAIAVNPGMMAVLTMNSATHHCRQWTRTRWQC